MGHRFLVPMSALVAATAAVLLAPSPVAGQGNTKVAAKTWAVPHTANGQPDLQGLWTNATITPFERPKDLAGKEFFTEEEAAAYEKRIAQNSNRDRRGDTAEADVAGAYNDFWFDRGNKIVPTRRTSLVIDPPDGKVPPLTAQAQKAAAARTEISRRPPWGPEDMGLPERCLLCALRLQQQLSDSPGSRIRRDPHRNDPRCSDHPAGRASASSTTHSPVAGRFARPLGWQYIGRRHHQFHG